LAALQAVATGTDGMIVAPTFPMLRDATQKTFLGLCEKVGVPVTFWKAEERAKIGHANVYFRSTEYPDRLRGPNLGWAYLDEAALMPERAWQVILGRLRVGNPRAWVTTTPAGFNWVWKYFVSERRENYEAFYGSTRDNYFNPQGYLADLEANYTAEFARQEIDGAFVAFEGLVYSEVRPDVHVVKAFRIPDDWQRVRAIDFGFTNPFVCLWGAVDTDGRLYVYDEHYRRRELIKDHADAIKRREDPVQWTVADHDAQDAAELASCGVYTTPAQKAVLVGIQKVKSRLATQGDGKPRLFFFDSVVNTLKEVGMYRWADGKAGKNEKEEPIKESDHAMDALRYMVMQIDNATLPRVTFI
jgi:PBSX family phage terminase large subunit